MTVIGLTGGIASGKSTASEHLRALGAILIDADRLGHRSYEPGTPGFEKVVNAFGHDIVGKDGTIDRRILGGKVFGAPEEMDRLNAIVWPEIRRLVAAELRELKRRDRNAIIVLEAAVLLEAGWQDLCDEVWVVTTTVKTAVERLSSRNGLSEEAAMARINSQMSVRERAEYADVKIDNSGTEEQLRGRIDRAWKALEKRLEEQRQERTASRPARGASRQPPRAAARRR
jgi:phosphopantetheine adenylyltransferase/dephospho-CoA kinase